MAAASGSLMQVSQNLADQIVRLVHSEGYRPAKPRTIVALLERPPEDYREVKRTIKWLVGQGQLVYQSNHLVTSPESAKRESDGVLGTFRRARDGYGFVRPHGTEGDDLMPDDIFVPPGKTYGAFDGDTVKVALRPRSGRSGGRGSEGHVVTIVERARRQFTGTFGTAEGQSVVYLDGVHFDEPISVGDTRGLPLSKDDKVVIELVRFPNDAGVGGEGVIIEVLGSSKNPAVDTLAIMRQYHLPEEFPEHVLDNARRIADEFDPDTLPPDRRDLTGLFTITIDPRDARDFDDAISLERIERGHWRLWVHIADVAHFVPEGSDLDLEARARATSVYLPDRVVPMLPEVISNHLASLQPERVRFTKTAEIEYSADGILIGAEVYNSAIRSDVRLNYEQVDRFLADRIWGEEQLGPDVCTLLDQMHTLAMMLRQRRTDRGALNMDLPEVKLELDKAGKIKGAQQVEHTESHQIIEEYMLAANQAVATWLDDLELPFLHRVHPPPDRRKLRQLTRFVRDIGVHCEEMEDRHEIQRVLDLVSKKPIRDAVNYAVLKAMSKAVYSPEVEGHYALDMQHYCHFTSPIRRYPDLTVHRLVQRLNEGQKTPSDPLPMLVRLGHHCSDQERNAESAERELIRLKLLHHLNKHIGSEMDAVIVNVKEEGFVARGIDLPADGFVPLSALPADQYRFERRGRILSGHKPNNQFRLGDRVTVRIDQVDLRNRDLYFKLVQNHSSRKRASAETARDESQRSDRPRKQKDGKKKKQRRR